MHATVVTKVAHTRVHPLIPVRHPEGDTVAEIDLSPGMEELEAALEAEEGMGTVRGRMGAEDLHRELPTDLDHAHVHLHGGEIGQVPGEDHLVMREEERGTTEGGRGRGAIRCGRADRAQGPSHHVLARARAPGLIHRTRDTPGAGVVPSLEAEDGEATAEMTSETVGRGRLSVIRVLSGVFSCLVACCTLKADFFPSITVFHIKISCKCAYLHAEHVTIHITNGVSPQSLVVESSSARNGVYS